MKKFQISISSKKRIGEDTPRQNRTWITDIHGVINGNGRKLIGRTRSVHPL